MNGTSGHVSSAGRAACVVPGLLAAGLLALALAGPNTDDLWWHLGLGRAFAAEGPWLAADPLIFEAPRPPSTSSWLAEVAFYRVLEVGGFGALRVGHLALMLLTLGLAGHAFYRESRSAALASAGVIAFATLASFRLIQLRPHFATLIGAVLLYTFALRPRRGPSNAAIAGCALGMGLWANLHPGFLLGPASLGVALGGVVMAPLWQRRKGAADERRRAVRLAWLLALGVAASLVNPAGFDPHLALYAAGDDSPSLSQVDEWAPLALFAWPGVSNAAPSAASWLLAWALWVAVGTLSALALRRARQRQGGDALDPALLGLAWMGIVAPLGAVRFLWLGFFPLLLLAQHCGRARRDARATAGWTSALCVALLANLVWLTPLSRLPAVRNLTSPVQPGFNAGKYYAHPIWLMRDAGLEGSLFTEYSIGGFAGFWLAPRVQTVINGSLNVAPGGRAAALQRRGPGFEDALKGLDLYLGTGMPVPEFSRGGYYTTTHLERTPGWIPVFRNANSALYLRANAEPNLERLARFYRERGLPFDPKTGFDAERVVRENPEWAVDQGMIPPHFAALEAKALGVGESAGRVASLAQLASLYAVLGLYDRALELESLVLTHSPQAPEPRRRRLWSLLHAGRLREARVEARALASVDDELSRATLALVGALPSLAEDRRETRIRTLPLLRTAQGRALASTLVSPAWDRPLPPARTGD